MLTKIGIKAGKYRLVLLLNEDIKVYIKVAKRTQLPIKGITLSQSRFYFRELKLIPIMKKNNTCSQRLFKKIASEFRLLFSILKSACYNSS